MSLHRLSFRGRKTIKRNINQTLVETGIACGRIEEILGISYLRQGHQRRQRIMEAVASARIDDRSTTPDRLYGFLADIPVEAHPNFGAEHYAAEIFRALTLEDVKSGSLGRAARTIANELEKKAGRDLLAAADKLFRKSGNITRETRVAYVLYLRKALSPLNDLPISGFLGGISRAIRYSPSDFEQYFANLLLRSARFSLDNALTLRHAVNSAYAVLDGIRSSSAIHGIAELLFAGHPLSCAETAKKFDISRIAARNHLLRLEKEGIAREATRRRSGLIYIAVDGLMSVTARSPSFSPALQPPRLHDTRPELLTPLNVVERQRLEEIGDAITGHIADLDRRLARLDNMLKNLAGRS